MKRVMKFSLAAFVDDEDISLRLNQSLLRALFMLREVYYVPCERECDIFFFSEKGLGFSD